MNKKRQGFLEWLKSIVVNIVDENLDLNAIDETIYFRKPNGENEYAKIYYDNGHEDIADRIFEEEGYNEVLKKINEETGRDISKWDFLAFAGYILVNEGGIKKIIVRKGQEDTPQLIYCSYALNVENLEFVTKKKEEFKYYDPIIDDMYSEPNITEKQKSEREYLVNTVKSAIEEFKAKQTLEKDGQTRQGESR